MTNNKHVELIGHLGLGHGANIDISSVSGYEHVDGIKITLSISSISGHGNMVVVLNANDAHALSDLLLIACQEHETHASQHAFLAGSAVRSED